MIKNAAAVLLTVLQLNNLKHAQEQVVGIRRTKPMPKLPKTPHRNVSLNPTPTNPASAPNTPATPAAETGKVPPSKPMNAPTGNADGAPITDDETGSVLMPPQ